MRTIHISQLKPSDFIINVGKVKRVEEFINGYEIHFESYFLKFQNMIFYSKSIALQIK